MELTRRGFLRRAAGAAVAATLPGCSRSGPALITGAIVGRVEERGHLLRGIPAAAGAPEGGAAVIVVGGGMAGLSAAWRLRRSGVDDVLSLELEDVPGGTAQGGETAVSRHPWGAHYVPVPMRDQRAVVALFEELGLVDGFDGNGRVVPVEDHVLRDPEERLFYRGEWTEGLYLHDGASGDDQSQRRRFLDLVAGFSLRVGSDGRRAFTLPVANCSRDPDLLALDGISMAAWMDGHGFDSPRLRWWVEYGTRDDYGGRLDVTSAWAALHYFCARRAGPGDEGAEYLTWPEGNQFLVDALTRGEGGRRVTGAVVSSIVEDGGRVRVTWIDAAAGTAHTAEADHVVCAVPRFIARRIVPALAGESGGFTYAPWVVANVSLRSRPRERGFPRCWDNVLYESESLGYVVATHQTDRLGDDAVWTWYRPFPDADERASRARVLAEPWETWRDAVMDDLVRAHPDLADHVERIDVRRWGHAMVRPRPGFLWGPERAAAAAPVGRIHFAGADLGGLPLFEEAQWQGVRAAEEILAALGRDVVSLL